MNNKQCKKFIHRYKKDVKFSYDFHCLRLNEIYTAAALHNTIYINKPKFKKLNKESSQFVLLHELGHLCNYPKFSSLPERHAGICEYESNKWAYYNTTNKRIKKIVIKRFEYWKNAKDISQEHYNAHLIYKEKGI